MIRAAVALALAFAAAPGAYAAQPLTVRATVEPSQAGIGEPVLVRVDAIVGDGVAPEQVRVDIDPGSLTPLGPPRRERVDGAVRVSQRLACLGLDCVPGERARTIVLPAARASAGTVAATGPRLRLRLVPRVPAAAVGKADPPFRRTVAPPAPAYPVAPDRLAGGLVAGAGLLVLLALALVGRELRRRGAPAAPRVDPLLRAVRLLRESTGRPPPDRRRAAGLLARVLSERGATPLADAAGAVAWSAAVPEPTDTEALARRVEEAVG